MRGSFALGALAAGCLAAACGPAHAAPGMTAGDLQEICTATNDPDKTACRIYILGVASGIRLGLAIADKKAVDQRVCLPEDATEDTLAFAVKKTLGEFLAAYPEDKSLSAEGFIGAALANKWPCPKP